MTGSQIIPFTYDGKEYQIRIISDGATIHIRAFLDDKPANGFAYQIDIMDVFGLNKLLEFDGIKDLIESAKEDIRLKRWPHLLESMEKSRKKDSQ